MWNTTWSNWSTAKSSTAINYASRFTEVATQLSWTQGTMWEGGVFFGLDGANKWFHSQVYPLRVLISVAIINYYASLGDKRTNKTKIFIFLLLCEGSLLKRRSPFFSLLSRRHRNRLHWFKPVSCIFCNSICTWALCNLQLDYITWECCETYI